MSVISIPSGPIVTNAIVISSDGEAVIVDPAPGAAKRIEESVKGLEVKSIILTHTHWDHIGDCADVKEQFKVPVLVHAEDAPNLEQPGVDGLPMMTPIKPVKPDGFLEDGQVIEVGKLKLEVMHTPGHAPGLCCFYCKSEKFLVSGDLVFKGSIGTLSLPTGQPDRMWTSLDRVANLPADTVIYPGHGDSTTVGDENWLPRAREIFGGG